MGRVEKDNYVTPDAYAKFGVDTAISILNKKKAKDITFMEPGCGDFQPHLGFFKDRYPEAKMIGVDVRDVEPKQGEEVISGCDFLRTPEEAIFEAAGITGGVDLIVTNPPYSHALEFIFKSLVMLSKGGVAGFLLKLDFLGSKGRASLFSNTPFHSLCVSAGRPSFVNGSTDMHNYGYFFWKNGYLDKPTISWFTV